MDSLNQTYCATLIHRDWFWRYCVISPYMLLYLPLNVVRRLSVMYVHRPLQDHNKNTSLDISRNVLFL